MADRPAGRVRHTLAAALAANPVTLVALAWLLPMRLVAYLASTAPEGDRPGTHLLVAIGGWTATAVTLLVLDALVLRRVTDRARALLAPVAFAVAGAARAVVDVVAPPALGLERYGTPWGIAVVAVVNSVIGLGVLATVIHLRRRGEAALRILVVEGAAAHGTQERIAAQLAVTTAELEEVRAEIVVAVTRARERLAVAVADDAGLTAPTLAEVVAEIEATARDLVSPASHVLVRGIAVPSGSPPGAARRRTPRTPSPTSRQRWGPLLTELPTVQPFRPGVTVAVSGPVALAAMVADGWSRTDQVHSLAFALSVLVLAVASRVTRSHPLRPGAGGLVLVVVVLAGMALVAEVTRAALSSPGDVVYLEATLLPVVVAAGTAVGLAMERQRVRLEELAREPLAAARWEVARTRLLLWSQRRRLGLMLHDQVQTALTSSVLTLSTVGAAAAAQVDALLVESQRVADASAPALATVLDEIMTSWEGTLVLDVEASPDVVESLDGDPVVVEAVRELVRECLLDAVHHEAAMAGQVVVGPIGDRQLELLVATGTPAIGRPARPGGFDLADCRELFDTLTTSWSWQEAGGWRYVQATVPVQVQVQVPEGAEVGVGDEAVSQV